MQWYALKIALGREDLCRAALLRKLDGAGLGAQVGQVLCPDEPRADNKAPRKLYPGYLFIEATPDAAGKLPAAVWGAARGVADIGGDNAGPAALPGSDIARLLAAAQRPETVAPLKTSYKPGDPVRVCDGPFANFSGTVEAILADKGLVRIVIFMFGRAASLELEYWQVERAL